MLPFFKSN